MNWTDETLMAFVDGELDAGGQRADLEHALASDAALQARVAALQTQRGRISAAFAAVLDGLCRPFWPLLANAPGAPSAAVVELTSARIARAQRARCPDGRSGAAWPPAWCWACCGRAVGRALRRPRWRCLARRARRPPRRGRRHRSGAVNPWPPRAAR